MIIEVLDVVERDYDDLVTVMLDNGEELTIPIKYTPVDMLVGLELDEAI